ncbi:MAG: tetratricopeptide repeat protein [Bdellovibrionales bacterium]|nr:tetratricopeptide repeat protein [Bdellovibrionales bacterium]
MKKVIILLFFGALFSCQLGQKRKKQGNNHLILGVSLLKKCDNQRALTHLRQAVKLNKKDPLAHHTLAVAYFALEEYALSEKSLKNALKWNDQLTESRVTLAKVYLNQKKIGKALKVLSVAKKDLTYPGYFKISNLLGEAYFKRKDWLLARKWFTEASRQPKGMNQCFTYTYLGQVEFELKNYKSSVDFLNKAAAFCQKQKKHCKKQKYPEQYFLARSYVKLNKKSRSKYHLKIFLQRTDKTDPLFAKAKALLQTL